MTTPRDIEWARLSESARATLRDIALPLSWGLSLDEIGTQLGIPRTTASTRLSRLRAELSAPPASDPGSAPTVSGSTLSDGRRR